MTTQFSAQDVAKFENETWSRCARNYVDGFGALVQEAVPALLGEVAVHAGNRVLDLGTGPGIVAAMAAERGAEVVGVDFSQPMIDEARRRHASITFRTASADDLPFDDGEFDVVTGNFMLHHCGRPQAVLEESHRVLRDGGRIGLTVWAEPSKLEAFGLFFAAVEEHAGAAELPHGPLFGVSDFAVFHRMLQQAGFGDSSVTELNMAWRTPSLEPYLTAFREWANLAVLPAETREAIETTVRQNAPAYRTNGLFILPNPAILMSATK
ncbi:MAG TPA: methyltransferase domain-containing protein [Candidatus Binatia bacterium]|jgi:ubiquinone/menaquinone biosynthesis C-methylase UbiE|nr:methyltransferase domain-containing protein [Candidatus Binatia bacterium]